MPDDAFQFDVLLSHSAKDKAVVRDLAKRLKKDGLRVWFDEWEIRPGDSIPAKIEEGLERSRVLVLCMSANAFGSDWAQLESATLPPSQRHASPKQPPPRRVFFPGGERGSVEKTARFQEARWSNFH